MSSWLNRLFRRRRPASSKEQLRALKLQSVSVFSQQGLDAYERAQSPLDEADEALATELIIASHQKDNDKIKNIGRQLNDAGGIGGAMLVLRVEGGARGAPAPPRECEGRLGTSSIGR